MRAWFAVNVGAATFDFREQHVLAIAIAAFSPRASTAFLVCPA